MLDINAYLFALLALVGLGVVSWLVSIARRDVSIVDSLWSLMFLLTAVVYAGFATGLSARGSLVLGMVLVWSVRLSLHITVRNWGEGEDHRYQQIRANNEPGFRFKSLYLVFGLQAVLAWIISVPLVFAIGSAVPLGWLDLLGVLLWITGMVFESGGDYQLLQFRRDETNRGKVLDSGFWRYTRHPNYFGEATLWWGYFMLALAAGGWWTIYAPVIMTFLLLRVSGVALLEKTIHERRPAYREYIIRTNAFFPGPRKANGVE